MKPMYQVMTDEELGKAIRTVLDSRKLREGMDREINSALAESVGARNPDYQVAATIYAVYPNGSRAVLDVSGTVIADGFKRRSDAEDFIDLLVRQDGWPELERDHMEGEHAGKNLSGCYFCDREREGGR